MDKNVYIKRRDKADNLYSRLQDQALLMIQQLSGKRWTDFNEHDPGVTMLDVLHYALLELDYVFESPFEAFLADPGKKELIYKKVGLLPPDEIFAPVIVTAEDYELLIGSVEGVRDCRVLADDQSVYTFLVETDEGVDREVVRHKILAVYHQHRNLCENVGGIYFQKITDKKWEHISGRDTPEYTPLSSEKRVTPNDFIYQTIQYELPECYGISERGLPPGATIKRKVEALHLKAYLLIYDYLLSGVSQQLKNIRHLLTLSDKIPPPFRIEVNIPEINRLLDKDKFRQSVVFDSTVITQQKNAFFDQLDLLYGEDTSKYPRDKSLAFRARLIRLFPELNTRRFCSFNLLDTEMKSMPGIKQLINVLTGNESTCEMSVINHFSRYNLKLITDETFFEELQGLFSIEFLLGDDPELPNPYEISMIPRIFVKHSLRRFYQLHNQLNLFRHQILFEGFLRNGMEPENFRCLYLHDKSGYLLLYKQPGRKEWINLGFFFEKQRLIETCNCLWAFIEKMNRESFSFYFIEHILLWEEPYIHSGECNKLTIVVPRWIDRYFPREEYLALFEERLPAHLDIYCIWMGVEDIKLFEAYYFKWRTAWAHNDTDGIVEFSKEIKELIQLGDTRL